MKMNSIVGLFFLILGVLSPHQELPLVVYSVAPNISFSMDGEPKIHRLGKAGYAPFFPDEVLLRGENFRKELELVEEQERTIDRILDQCMRFRNEFARENPIVSRQPFLPQVVTNYLDFGREIELEYQELLLPHQVERALEIHARVGIRTHGFVKFIVDSQQNYDLNLSKNEVKRLKTKCSELSSQFSTSLEEINRIFFEESTKGLSEEQLRKFRVLSKNHPMPVSDFVVAELEHFARKSKQDEDNAETATLQNEDMSSFHRDDMAAANPIDIVSRSKTLQWQEEEGSWKIQVDLMDKTSASLFLAEILCTNSSIKEIANISDQQVEKLLFFKTEIEDDSVLIDEEFLASHRSGNHTEADHNLKKSRKSLDARASSTITSLLNPGQLKPIAQAIRLARLSRENSILLLLYGHFDSDLEISESQRVRLDDELESASTKLREMLVELEEKHIREIISVLDDSNRTLLSNAFGERPKHLYPSILLLQRNLEIPRNF
jgi:hypothetical protein